MTRKKVKLAYITNDSARKATFKKRKKGLMKKVSELSTLCGIEACAIMYSPYDSQPEVWPSPMGVQRVLSKFKKIPEMEQSKKMVNQESFLGQRITKANDQLKKQCKENREKEMTQVMFQNLVGKADLHGLNILDLNDLGWLIDQNLKDINKRVETLNKTSSHSQGSSSSLAAGAPASATTMTMVTPEATPRSGGHNVQITERSASVGANMDSIQRHQWIMELMNNNNHNPQNYAGFGGDVSMMLPFGDNTHINALWSNAFFPWEK